MGSLMDSITASISPLISRSLASSLGEPADAIQRALQMGSATIVAALAIRVQESGFISRVTGLVAGSSAQSMMNISAAAGRTSTVAASAASSNFLDFVFGTNRSTIERRIAQVSGLSLSSAGAVMSTAAPLVLSSLASKMGGLAEDATALDVVLIGALPKLRNLIPSGLPGLNFAASSAVATTEGERPSYSAASAIANEASKSGNNWLWPILLFGALLIGSLLWYFNHGARISKPSDESTVVNQMPRTLQAALTR